MSVSKADRRHFTVRVQNQIKRAARLDAEIAAAVNRAVDRARSDLLALVAELKNRRTLQRAEIDALRAAYQARLDGLIGEIVSIMQRGVTAAQDAGVESLIAPLEILKDFRVDFSATQAISPQMAEVASDYAADLVRSVVGDALDRINGQLRRAILGGLTPYEVSHEIDRIIGMDRENGVSYTAQRIVRTELTRAHSMGAQAGYNHLADQLPDEERARLKKQWISAKQPGRTRPGHWQADGQIVAYNEPFLVENEGREEELDFPGDPKGSPGNTINCLCRMVIVMDDVIDYRNQKGKLAEAPI